MGHVISGKRAASYLNSISEKQFQFTALKNPKCKLEDVLKTMEELKEVVFYFHSFRQKEEHFEFCGRKVVNGKSR